MSIIEVIYPTLWKEYALLDSGEGERLERFGSFVFRRPDPQVLWKRSLSSAEWDKADAVFARTHEDKGDWRFVTRMQKRFAVHYGDMTLMVEPTPFKHLGLFPEQSVHWDWMRKQIEKRQQTIAERQKIQVLNLFGYTGGASIACAKSGAFVTHVDASKPAITWAKENQQACGVAEDGIRWILDDVLAFVRREARRGKKYDAIIMDPPAFGHGAKGEVWKFHTHFPQLLQACTEILSEKPLFMLVNAYAVSVSSLLLFTMLEESLRSYNGETSCGELALRQEDSERILSTGIFGKWSSR